MGKMCNTWVKEYSREKNSLQKNCLSTKYQKVKLVLALGRPLQSVALVLFPTLCSLNSSGQIPLPCAVILQETNIFVLNNVRNATYS